MNEDIRQSRAEVEGLRGALEGLKRVGGEAVRGMTGNFSAFKRETREASRNIEALSRGFSRDFSGALDRAFASGARLSDVMRGLALDLSKTALKSALAPAQDFLGGALANITGGLFSQGGGLFARGGVFLEGKPEPFARGGIFGGGLVNGPTLFPMRGGKTGLMGEAGPEAIMPLKRGPDGRLGVSAGGGGASVTVNITTPDMAGFSRSRSQIAAQIARAVQAGQRNL